MAASAPRHVGEAKVVSVGKDALTLSHGAIPTMKWGPMTMDFRYDRLTVSYDDNMKIQQIACN